MYRNIIYFFSFPFIIRKVCMGRVKENRRWIKCTHTHTHTHVIFVGFNFFFFFFGKHFCFALPVSKHSTVYIIFRKLVTLLLCHLLNPCSICTWAFALGHVHIRFCHTRNTCSMFKGSSSQYSTLRVR